MYVIVTVEVGSTFRHRQAVDMPAWASSCSGLRDVGVDVDESLPLARTDSKISVAAFLRASRLAPRGKMEAEGDIGAAVINSVIVSVFVVRVVDVLVLVELPDSHIVLQSCLS